jgi:hypothetical protein
MHQPKIKIVVHVYCGLNLMVSNSLPSNWCVYEAVA